MIKRAFITNFQSHEKTWLEFAPGLTAVIGSSDSGKSAVLRAMNWVVNNRPLGAEFVSTWSKDVACNVILDFVDEKGDITTIERVRTKNDNMYVINGGEEFGGERGMELKAFGAEVPDEVACVVNMNEINLQRQLDAPFLLSESSGEVARYLNSIVNFDVIDRSLANIERIKRQHKRDLADAESSLADAEEALQQYENIDILEQYIAQLEQLQQDTNTACQQYKQLTTLIDEYTQAQIEVDIYPSKKCLQTAGKVIEAMLDKVQAAVAMRKQHTQLLSAIDDYTRACTAAEAYPAPDVLEGACTRIEQLQRAAAEITEMRQQYKQLAALIDECNDVVLEIDSIIANITELDDTFAEIMPTICPLCGQEVSDEAQCSHTK